MFVLYVAHVLVLCLVQIALGVLYTLVIDGYTSVIMKDNINNVNEKRKYNGPDMVLEFPIRMVGLTRFYSRTKHVSIAIIFNIG